MSQITDEPKALNESGDETATDTTPVAEEQATEEVAEPEVEVTAETEGESTETVESPKKGYSARVRELNAKAKAAEEKAKSLEERIAELTGSVEPQREIPAYNPQEPLIAPGEEIDATELNKRQSERETKILQQADSMAQLRARQSEAIVRIHNETSEVMRAYPELDPESDTFDRDLSDAVTEAVENGVKANPYTVSVKGVVAKLMKPYKGAVTKEVGKATENIARQVSESALKPTSIRKDEKALEEKSIEELEAELGTVQA